MAKERLKNSNDYIKKYQEEIDRHVIKGITYKERQLIKKAKNEQMGNA
jgi:membrane-bound lytic murein transglycosylase MltF